MSRGKVKENVCDGTPPTPRVTLSEKPSGLGVHTELGRERKRSGGERRGDGCRFTGDELKRLVEERSLIAAIVFGIVQRLTDLGDVPLVVAASRRVEDAPPEDALSSTLAELAPVAAFPRVALEGLSKPEWRLPGATDRRRAPKPRDDRRDPRAEKSRSVRSFCATAASVPIRISAGRRERGSSRIASAGVPPPGTVVRERNYCASHGCASDRPAERRGQ